MVHVLFDVSLGSHWLIYVPVSVDDLRVIAVIVRLGDRFTGNGSRFKHIHRDPVMCDVNRLRISHMM